MMMGPGWVITAAATATTLAAWWLLAALVWRPRAVTEAFAAQGVRGPGYRLFAGNLGDIRRIGAAAAGRVLGDVADHDYTPLAMARFHAWIPLYGRVFLHWFGAAPNLCVAELSMAKQVLADRTGAFHKYLTHPDLVRLLGTGLVLADGDLWKRHRKVVQPAFNVDKLKMVTAAVTDCAMSMVSGWEARLASHGEEPGGGVEIELSGQFFELAANVISHTAFGTSYREGKQVFLALRELQVIAFSNLLSVQIPGSRYVPTAKNQRIWKLDREVRSLLMAIIQKRLAHKDTTAGYGEDLLGLMLDAAYAPGSGGGEPLTMSLDEIVDECKTFFLAGQETTSQLLTWTMFLLSTHPGWQEKLREEVLRECAGQGHPPTHHMLGKLKLVNLFLLETLRLYSSVPLIRRKTTSQVVLGNITVPKDTIITIPIPMVHRDREVWGDDAGEFNPLRFEGGADPGGKANNLMSNLLSFAMGPRSCIGKNYAMIEAKAIVAIVLQRFSLTLSPKYVHAPMDMFVLRPKFGLPMIVRSSVDASMK